MTYDYTDLLLVLLSASLTLILTFAFVVIRCRCNTKPAVAFFHTYTNDGDGGERVIWCAVKTIQELSPHLDCVVYTGDHVASSDSLLARAVDRFGVKLHYPPKVMHLHKRKWIEETTYPRFTMIGQSLGLLQSISRGKLYAKFTPFYYFDTSGYAFTYPLARLFGCKVICYTHYPTISLDMLSRVRDRSAMYNNEASIAKSTWLSRCKVIYYTLFSRMYGIIGSSAHLAMVNSSWTQSHIEKLWQIPSRTKRVYPPCDTSGLQYLTSCTLNRCFHSRDLPKLPKSSLLLNFVQRRWTYLYELMTMRHSLQLEAFSVAVRKVNRNLPRPKLQFVGSCRYKADEDRLQNLKDKAIELKVEGDVELHKNVMYRELVELLGGATVGIHSMIDEHFGISVVEYMAAGAIPIAHNSAGPKMDIVLEEDGQQTGFLAENVGEYADAIHKIIRMTEAERLEMAAAARKRAGRFSEQRFYHDFNGAVKPVLCHASK